jgi:type II secretory ATPase GspE/PulE/Tfp pilus assembly ATPase PilB-like protein
MLNAEIVNKDEEIIRFVDELLKKAVKEGATHIHVEPQKEHTAVRFRKNGSMYYVKGYEKIPKQLHDYIVSRFKVLSGVMKIDVKKKPQDGKIVQIIDGKERIFRVLTLPTIHGESVNLENLDTKLKQIGIEDFFSDDKVLVKKFKDLITLPDGAVLFTGPTGCGKSTLITSALLSISDPEIKITTVEDPVEAQIANIEQIQVSNLSDTMADLARAACMGWPDVLYLSELRDYETAKIAMEYAMNGNLVISSLYTNNSVNALFRLSEMGVKEYMTGTVLRCVISLRLQNLLCPHCKEKAAYTKTDLKAIGLTESEMKTGKFFKRKGCDKCGKTGNIGRVAIVEILELNENLKVAFINGASSKDIEKIAKYDGVYYTLNDDALAKFKNGLIDIETARMFAM